MRPIPDLARDLGLQDEEVELYGRHVAKVNLSVVHRLADRRDGRLVVVTGISPTPLGEGKTTTTIGLVQALCRLGAKAAATIRQPSLGPVFGVKGGAAGGGRSQVVPADRVNFHLTGDNHAVAIAHNLASAFLDNHLHHGNLKKIDPRSITWPRVVDLNDRALRKVVVGLGGRDNGLTRETEWIIASASEVMAVFALATDLTDLRRRLGRIVVAQDESGSPVTLEDLKVAGAMAKLLEVALQPNLMTTMEGGPAFIHAGPFANVAHGASSVVADRLALKLCDIVCTEAGFGADLGAEKFFDLKCRQSGLRPSAAVVVAMLRTLKVHAGVGKVVAGKPIDPALLANNPDAVRRGAENLRAHIEIVRKYGVPVVVAFNAMPEDTAEEFEAAKQAALDAGADAAVMSRHFEEGGAGALDLARAVLAATEKGAPQFKPIYEEDLPLAQKIERIAREVYGADGVDLTKDATTRLAQYEKWGFGRFGICMTKTQYSLSADPTLRGRPRGFRVPVRDARLSAGAGFVIAMTGDLQLMPGLPKVPAGEAMDVI
jgi:formate--tetrahydrofolate ligase